jgi:putative endonuclease
MFYVYVLRSSKTGRRYVGSCEDLGDRLRRHNAGESKATKHGIPWTLLHAEPCESRSAAIMKERYYKTGSGRDEIDRISVSGRRGDRSQVQILSPRLLIGPTAHKSDV